MTPRSAMRSRGQRGATLIEGLISIAIFSLGIIGLGGLQTQLLAFNTQSQFRAQASYLSEELLGLVVADRANAACYTMSATTPPSCANAIAQAAAEDWRARVIATLPGAGTTPPAVTLGADGTFGVTLLWQRPTEPTQHNFVSTTNLYPGL